jgi:hypothetical protein
MILMQNNTYLRFLDATGTAQIGAFGVTSLNRTDVVGRSVGINSESEIYMEAPTLLNFSTEYLQLYPYSSNAPEVRMWESTGSFYTSIKSGAVSSNLSFQLPTSAPLTGQVIAASTTGELYFTSITAGTAREFTGPSFTYDAGSLTRIDYDDGSYKEFTYSVGQLTQIDFFITGGDTIRKTFNYTGDVLTSIDQTTL